MSLSNAQIVVDRTIMLEGSDRQPFFEKMVVSYPARVGENIATKVVRHCSNTNIHAKTETHLGAAPGVLLLTTMLGILILSLEAHN